MRAHSAAYRRMHADRPHVDDEPAKPEPLTRSEATKAGLERARKNGVKLGRRRGGACKLTTEERSRGGKTAGRKKRKLARDRYVNETPRILSWRNAGWSCEKIAQRLHSQGIKAPAGGKPTSKLVERIIKRALSLNAPGQR